MFEGKMQTDFLYSTVMGKDRYKRFVQFRGRCSTSDCSTERVVHVIAVEDGKSEN